MCSKWHDASVQRPTVGLRILPLRRLKTCLKNSTTSENLGLLYLKIAFKMLKGVWKSPITLALNMP